MIVNREKKEMHLRVTEMSGCINCLKQAALVASIAGPEQQEDTKRAYNLDLGDRVHKAIYASIKGEPIVMQDDVKAIIDVPAIFLDLNVRGLRRVTLPALDMNDTEKLVWARKNYYKVMGLDRVIQKVDSLELDPNLTILDVIAPTMFKKKLDNFEAKHPYDYVVDGWKLSFSGTLDAFSDDGKLIVDWKTSKTEPYSLGGSMNYYLQQTLYRSLYCKAFNKPLSEGWCILGYIIKTKVPKFKPVPFRISFPMLLRADDYIRLFAKTCIAAVQDGIFPEPSYSEKCGNCSVAELCQAQSGLVPEFCSLGRLYSELEV